MATINFLVQSCNPVEENEEHRVNESTSDSMLREFECDEYSACADGASFNISRTRMSDICDKDEDTISACKPCASNEQLTSVDGNLAGVNECQDDSSNIPLPPPLPPILPSASTSNNGDVLSSVDGGDKLSGHDVDLGEIFELLHHAGLPDELEFTLDSLSSEMHENTFPFKTGSKLYTAECLLCFQSVRLYRRNCCKNPVCQECLESYFTTLIKDGTVAIQCPCCSVYVDRDEIMYFLETELKLKFYRFLINANKDPHKKLCPRCNVVTEMPIDVLRDPQVKTDGLQICCSTCSLIWCFPCQAPWHEGITCKDYRHGDKLVKTWAKGMSGTRNAQRCPKCKIFIERISGCDHMTCQHCSAEFCYLCGETFRSVKYIGNHYKKLSVLGCKYRFKPNNPGQRKLIRGSILGLKLLSVPVIAAVAVVVGCAAVGIGTVALPVWGARKLHKRRQIKKRNKRYRAFMELLQSPCSCSACTTMQVDPYFDRWQQQMRNNGDDWTLDDIPSVCSVWSTKIDSIDSDGDDDDDDDGNEDETSVWRLRKDIKARVQPTRQCSSSEEESSVKMTRCEKDFHSVKQSTSSSSQSSDEGDYDGNETHFHQSTHRPTVGEDLLQKQVSSDSNQVQLRSNSPEITENTRL